MNFHAPIACSAANSYMDDNGCHVSSLSTSFVLQSFCPIMFFSILWEFVAWLRSQLFRFIIWTVISAGRVIVDPVLSGRAVGILVGVLPRLLLIGGHPLAVSAVGPIMAATVSWLLLAVVPGRPLVFEVLMANQPKVSVTSYLKWAWKLRLTDGR